MLMASLCFLSIVIRPVHDDFTLHNIYKCDKSDRISATSGAAFGVTPMKLLA